MEAEWFLPILQNRRAKGLRRLKNWVSRNYSTKSFGLKFKLLSKNWMQPNFGFWKLMHLGQNKGKSRGWNHPKIKIFKIWFDTLIPLFFWWKNISYFNFRVKIDGFADTCFLHILRPLALRFWKIGRNHSASMNKYLKENLILGDWLENLFSSITLPMGWPWIKKCY